MADKGRKGDKGNPYTEKEFQELLLDIMYPIDYSFNEKPKAERKEINKEFKKQHGYDYETFIIARRCGKMDKAREVIAGRKETPKAIAEMPLNYLAIFSDWLKYTLGRDLLEESADILQQAYDLWQDEMKLEKMKNEEFRKFVKDNLSIDYDTMNSAKRQEAYDKWVDSIDWEEEDNQQKVSDMLSPAEMDEFKKYLKDCLSCDFDTMDEAGRRNAYDLWQESIAGDEVEN